MIYKCPVCNNIFKARPARQRRNKKVFCSPKCYHKSMVNSKRPLEDCIKISKNHSRHFLGKKHTEEAIEKNRQAHLGTNNINWRGGKRISSDGYICIYKPNHPFANSAKLVPEHRLIVEYILKRILNPKEVIHHIDENIKNNFPNNLYLFQSSSNHTKFHALLRKFPDLTLKSNI